jgi:hypothetical protein
MVIEEREKEKAVAHVGVSWSSLQDLENLSQ